MRILMIRQNIDPSTIVIVSKLRLLLVDLVHLIYLIHWILLDLLKRLWIITIILVYRAWLVVPIRSSNKLGLRQVVVTWTYVEIWVWNIRCFIICWSIFVNSFNILFKYYRLWWVYCPKVFTRRLHKRRILESQISFKISSIWCHLINFQNSWRLHWGLTRADSFWKLNRSLWLS